MFTYKNSHNRLQLILHSGMRSIKPPVNGIVLKYYLNFKTLKKILAELPTRESKVFAVF